MSYGSLSTEQTSVCPKMLILDFCYARNMLQYESDNFVIQVSRAIEAKSLGNFNARSQIW